MTRGKVLFQSQHPYYVRGRCARPKWFDLPMDLVWQIMCLHLNYIWYVHEAKIHSFTLLESEWRLILKTPNANIDKILHHLLGQTGRDLTRAAGRINQAYGCQNRKSVLSTEQHFRNAYKLLHTEAIEAGLATQVQDYKFCSLRGLLGLQWQPFPVCDDRILFSDIDGTLSWLNTPATINNLHTIRVATSRPKFWLPKQNKKMHKLEFCDI
jgi:hypothetical protein